MFVGKDKRGNVMVYESKNCYDTENNHWTYNNYLYVNCSIDEVVEMKEYFLKIYPLLDTSNLSSGQIVEEVDLEN